LYSLRSEVRLPLDQFILRSDCCEKMYYDYPAQVVFSYFALQRSKLPLVLTTKVTHLRSLLFRQQNGINCVVRTCSQITATFVLTSVASWCILAPNFNIFVYF